MDSPIGDNRVNGEAVPSEISQSPAKRKMTLKEVSLCR